MPDSTAVMIIDMQNTLTDEAYNSEQVLAKLRGVIDRARAADVPVIYIQHTEPQYEALNHGAPGWQINPALDPRPTDLHIEKFSSDAFTNTNLAAELEARGITHLIVGGLQSDFCVDSTCRMALSRGLNLTLIEDGHTTMDGAIPAEQIIKHHNFVLSNIGFPGRLRLQPAAEVLADTVAA